MHATTVFFLVHAVDVKEFASKKIVFVQLLEKKNDFDKNCRSDIYMVAKNQKCVLILKYLWLREENRSKKNRLVCADKKRCFWYARLLFVFCLQSTFCVSLHYGFKVLDMTYCICRVSEVDYEFKGGMQENIEKLFRRQRSKSDLLHF